MISMRLFIKLTEKSGKKIQKSLFAFILVFHSNLLYIMGELEGGGFVAVAVGLVTVDRWQGTRGNWQVTPDMWHVTPDTWHDIWHMTHNTFCKRTVINGLHIYGHITSVLLTYPTLSHDQWQCHRPVWVSCNMAASPCVEKGRRLRDWSARLDCGSGRPFGGSVEAFFGVFLKYYEARYLTSEGTTYKMWSRFLKAKINLKGSKKLEKITTLLLNV